MGFFIISAMFILLSGCDAKDEPGAAPESSNPARSGATADVSPPPAAVTQSTDNQSVDAASTAADTPDPSALRKRYDAARSSLEEQIPSLISSITRMHLQTSIADFDARLAAYDDPIETLRLLVDTLESLDQSLTDRLDETRPGSSPLGPGLFNFDVDGDARAGEPLTLMWRASRFTYALQFSFEPQEAFTRKSRAACERTDVRVGSCTLFAAPGSDIRAATLSLVALDRQGRHGYPATRRVLLQRLDASQLIPRYNALRLRIEELRSRAGEKLEASLSRDLDRYAARFEAREDALQTLSLIVHELETQARELKAYQEAQRKKRFSKASMERDYGKTRARLEASTTRLWSPQQARVLRNTIAAFEQRFEAAREMEGDEEAASALRALIGEMEAFEKELKKWDSGAAMQPGMVQPGMARPGMVQPGAGFHNKGKLNAPRPGAVSPGMRPGMPGGSGFKIQPGMQPGTLNAPRPDATDGE